MVARIKKTLRLRPLNFNTQAILKGHEPDPLTKFIDEKEEDLSS